MANVIQSSQSLNPLTSHQHPASSKFQYQPSSLCFNSLNTQQVQPISFSLASSHIFNNNRSSSMEKMALSATKGQYIREDYLVKKVSAKEVEEMVKGGRSVPLVVDFYATWCGPCILMAQELEMLAVEYENNAQFVKVDTDDEYEFARDMQVRGLPTLYFISPDSSKDAIRTEGLIPIDMIKNIIDNEM